MAQLKVAVADAGVAIRQPVREAATMRQAGQTGRSELAIGGGRVNTREALLGGPPDMGRYSPATAAAPYNALGNLGEALSQAAAQQQQLAVAEQRAADEVKANQARVAYRQALERSEADVLAGDPAGARQRFMDAARATADELGAGLPERSRASFLATAADMAASRGPSIQQQGIRLLQRQGLTALQADMAGAINDAADARNEVESATALGRARQILIGGVEAGFITPEQANARLQRLPKDVERAKVERFITASPRAAQRMLTEQPEAFGGLDPAERATLADEAGAAADAVEDRALAVDLRAERVAFQAAQATAHSAALDWFGSAGGGSDAPDLPGMTDLMQPDVLDAVRLVAMEGGGGSDDPAAIDELQGGVHADAPDEFMAKAARLLLGGRLSAAGLYALGKANAAAHGETPEARAWRATRSEAAARLAPPDLGPLGATLPDLNAPQRTALAELDAWREANPRASGREVQQAAREIWTHHRTALVERVVSALPRPIELEGVGEGIGMEAVETAEEAVLDAMAAGQIDDMEAARRLRLLDAWRWVAENPAEERAAR